MVHFEDNILPLAYFQDALFKMVVSIMGISLLLGGISLILVPIIGLEQILSFSGNYLFWGMVHLFLAILCGILNIIEIGTFQLKAQALITFIFGLGIAFLFTTWLIWGVLLLLLAIFITSILFNFQTSIWAFMLAQIVVSSILTWFALQVSSGQGLLVSALSLPWSILFVQLSIISTLFFLLAMVLVNVNSQALVLQEELKVQLDMEQKMLEERVAEQTRALDLTQEVNHLISTTLDDNRLIGNVVEKIRQTFGYYHVQIYLFQPDIKSLKIAGATGEAGTALLIGEHQLDLEEGIVGRSASNQATIVVDDVLESKYWIANSLLPDTIAEIAVPILSDGALVGVLDIQHDKVLGTIQRHTQVLEAIARQLGTAITNVSIFRQAEEQLKRDSVLNELALQLQLAPDLQSSMEIVSKQLFQALEPVSVKVMIDPLQLQVDEGE